MSVNQEFQFMAMLEGHELEKELLTVVSIFIFGWFSSENLFTGQIRPCISVQQICSWDKEVQFQVICDHHTPSQLLFNIIEE